MAKKSKEVKSSTRGSRTVTFTAEQVKELNSMFPFYDVFAYPNALFFRIKENVEAGNNLRDTITAWCDSHDIENHNRSPFSGIRSLDKLIHKLKADIVELERTKAEYYLLSNTMRSIGDRSAIPGVQRKCEVLPFEDTGRESASPYAVACALDEYARKKYPKKKSNTGMDD